MLPIYPRIQAWIPPPASPYSTVASNRNVRYSTTAFTSTQPANEQLSDMNKNTNRKTISSTSGWPASKSFYSSKSGNDLLRRLSDEERARQQKQIQEDYELAVRLSKQETVKFQRRAK